MTQRNKIPANTGVLLKGAPGTYVLPAYTGAVSPVENNLLVGRNTAATLDVTTTTGSTEYTNRVLAVVENELGFYNLKEPSTLAAHKAYLPIATSLLELFVDSKKVTVNFEKRGTTEIKVVELETNPGNTTYNLQGQKVQKAGRGIYIVDGRKTYIK